jgi:subtilisin family serine protease
VRRRLLPAVVAAATALALVGAVPGVPGSVTTAAAVGHVVVLDDGVADVATAARDLLAPWGIAPTRVYRHALAGFAASLPPAAAARLAADPRVAYVEADRTFTVTGAPTGVDRVDADRVLPLGRGVAVDVDVAVLDTGIDASHPDLVVHHRADCWSGLLGVVSPAFASDNCRAGRGDDDHGHGTHVAGTVGARDDGRGVVGVAPGARLWSVKVLGSALGTGATSDVVAGLDYVTARAGRIEVVNLSLGASGRSRALEDAVRAATRSGLVVVTAAGNDGRDAAGYTPANVPRAITVSAVTDLDGRPGARAGGRCSGTDDHFASYSNHGKVVDLAAPGSCIVSTRRGGGTAQMSGTSMAAPHVAGAAAWFVATRDLPREPTRWRTVRAALLRRAAPQDGPCGFAGGVSGEPLLDLDGCR